ncbi:Tumor necrosis factor receptor superfamily member 25 [Galemys pyrenaicus]|uniref:Tumor necrosis factor receptor superfamily member 25 n=1 Tax=Galemys pyrenaicus TaxID=202257 RepID=A0A8J6DFB1_GALPY|nr:Tumor necrosis factor receptor superfamily member 25 [Galemys pyrenaicus]
MGGAALGPGLGWGGEASSTVLQVVLLLLLGARGQGASPGPRCDCAQHRQKRGDPLCCGDCPAGKFQGSCTQPCGAPSCIPCPPGTFLAQEKHRERSCAACRGCDEVFMQVTLENCSAVADARCGCRPGWFPDCWDRACKDKSSFRCFPCVDCEALHRRPRVSCSRTDAECGACLPGFYEQADSCLSCPTVTLGSCPEPCAAICGWRQMFWVQVLLAGLAAPLLLGGLLACVYRRRRPSKPRVPGKRVVRVRRTAQSPLITMQGGRAGGEEAGMAAQAPLQDTHPSPRESIHALLVPPSEEVCGAHLVGTGWAHRSAHEVPWDQLPGRVLGPAPLSAPLPARPAGSAAATLQPGPQLYDVVDAVPARRWKEFVRTLGLREAEIEAVEVEVCRFRDQQYEMLQRWRQQQPADLGAVYAALERMGLGGCAEDLRRRLQQRGREGRGP